MSVSYVNKFPEEHPVSEIIFRMSNLKNNPGVDLFCIVEGKTDIKFYSNARIKELKGQNVKYLYKKYSPKDEFAGKEAVIKSYFTFKNLYRLIICKKCIFIVDHDVHGLVSQNCTLTDEDKQHITVLPCYSYESYFLYDDNLRIIFNTLVNVHEALNTFENKLTEFLLESRKYFALKSVITASYKIDSMKKYNFKYKAKNKDRDIFIFDFNNDKYFNNLNMDYEVNIMNKIVCESSYTRNYLMVIIREKIYGF